MAGKNQSKVYTPKQQQAIVKKQFPTVLNRLHALLGREAEQLLALSLERLSGQGFHVYGDKSFHKSKRGLKRETLEELADAIVYQAIYQAKERGEID